MKIKIKIKIKNKKYFLLEFELKIQVLRKLIFHHDNF